MIRIIICIPYKSIYLLYFQRSIVNDKDQSITFLYKFGEGACPKSHGFNAARLAEIPEKIINLGITKSMEFENFTKRIQLLKLVNVFNSGF